MPEKKEPPYLLYFLLLSLLLHLLLLWHYRYWQPAAKALEELRKKQARQIPVQIVELPPRPKKKITPKPPPKKPRFLADRNQRTKQETRVEESSPPPVKVRPQPPAPKPRPQVKPQPKAKPAPARKATAKAKPKTRPYKSRSGIPVAGKKIEKPRPKTRTEVKKQQQKPVKKAQPDLKKLFPTFNQLTQYDRERRRTAPPGPNRPHLPSKLRRSTEVSLNTLDYKFHSYYLALKRKIELVWEYPYAARRAGIQGRLLIRFVINQDGSLASVRILRSSGSGLLDQEAIRAIREAAAFPPLPARMNTKTLTVTATFEYLLSYRSVH